MGKRSGKYTKGYYRSQRIQQCLIEKIQQQQQQQEFLERIQEQEFLERIQEIQRREISCWWRIVM
jgi:hypothetical protein